MLVRTKAKSKVELNPLKTINRALLYPRKGIKSKYNQRSTCINHSAFTEQ
jgi:hypothetical protein